MKVLFVNRIDALENMGGDTIQMLKTKEELEKQNIKVDIVLGEQKSDIYNNYDIVHLFNIQTDTFILKEINKIKSKKIKLVVSPIWWNFEKEQLKDIETFGVRSQKISKILGINCVILLRSINLKLRYRRMKKILLSANMILPNSIMEKDLLIKEFNLKKSKFEVVYNGISNDYLLEKSYGNVREYALQVGRIEETKRTLMTIKACNELNIPLKIIGKKIDHNYYMLCKEEAKKGMVEFIGAKSQEELIEFYRKAKIHILPSLRETPGLVSLEAASQGCNIVSTCIGSAKDYFKDKAYYCNPYDYKSVKNSIKEAWNSESNNLSDYIRENFTWKIAAKQTLNAYEMIE